MDRDAFLARVGRASLTSELPDVRPTRSTLPDLPPADLLTLFRARSQAVNAVVHGPMSGHGVPRSVAGIAAGHGSTSFLAWDSLPVPGVAAALQSAGIARASVSVAMRGFGVAHHSLQLPPASDALLGPVIEREVRRLEPHLGDCVVQWMSLPPLESGVSAPPGVPPQRSIFATAAPSDVVAAFEHRLHDAGHRLEHLTTLPVAVQRLLEQFDSGTGTIATVLPLPDGAYIGFTLSGGVRLVGPNCIGLVSTEPPCALTNSTCALGSCWLSSAARAARGWPSTCRRSAVSSSSNS